ncbi:MAG TPA: hypothetical protein VGI28_01700, partial [Stellaceae bacterium]
PRSMLDARFQAGLAYAVHWGQMPSVRCAMCNGELADEVTYLVVLMPMDPDLGLGISGAVCRTCGQNLPRDRLQEVAEQTARVLFEPVAGHA